MPFSFPPPFSPTTRTRVVIYWAAAYGAAFIFGRLLAFCWTIMFT